MEGGHRNPSKMPMTAGTSLPPAPPQSITWHKSYYRSGPFLTSKLLRPYVALIPSCTKMWLIITRLRGGFRTRTADFLTDYSLKPSFLG